MKNTKVWTRVLGIIAMVTVVGFGFAACGDGGGGGGGGGSYTLNITNNRADKNITKVAVQGSFNNYQYVTKDVSIGPNKTVAVTFNPGGLIASLQVTFEDGKEAYTSGGLSEYGTYNLSVSYNDGSYGEITVE